jgi:transposase
MDELVRLREPNRKQSILQAVDLDRLIAEDHSARAIWRVLEGLDLSRFCAAIKAREGVAGRDATDPRMLLALWLYAITQGVNSAREIARLCEEHAAYRWICGGVRVNYHTLSDFRTAHQAALDELMSKVLAALMKRRLVRLYRVAQDGTRVRASAGASSFRRKPSLQRCLSEARTHIQELQREAGAAVAQREQAARTRAAREYEERCRQALTEFEQLSEHKAQAKNHPQRRVEVRASTTDPQARVMKMADGGYRPAYNLQLATDTESRMIVGVKVSNSGVDSQQLTPMLQEIERRTGQAPMQHLADGGYLNFHAIEAAAAHGIEVFVPLRKHRGYRDPHLAHPRDRTAIADYRRRMDTEQGKQIYRERASTAETVNADLKTWRGLDRLLVRGLNKVLSVTLLTALAYNLLRAIKLGWL